MPTADRKAAVAAYKERVAVPGVFAVRCGPTGEAWVGQSRNIDAQKTGLWFALNAGSYPNRDVQAAWKTHGEAAFAFEPLERLEPEPMAYVLNARLKDRLAHWMATLNAARL